MDVVGKNIRKYRKQKKWTQKKLALMTGFSQSKLSKMERGHPEITVTDLYNISNVLGIKPSDLLKEEENIEEEPINYRENLYTQKLLVAN